MGDIRFRLMRGDYHQRLIAWLLAEMARQGVTQESLASGIRMHQTTVGGILKKNKGTFDLDEAHALLVLLGSSLPAFVADPAHAQTVPDLDAKVRRLMTLPSFVSLVDALAVLSPDQQEELLSPFAALVRGPRPKRSGGSSNDRRQSSTRTRPGGKKHR